jgi:hypothetical protein
MSLLLLLLRLLLLLLPDETVMVLPSVLVSLPVSDELQQQHATIPINNDKTNAPPIAINKITHLTHDTTTSE